jgi:murein DD-endopeptidase MepM/ murein hydrolase activator NlpD
MSRLLVKEGDHVEAGQRIGLMGTTGHSTGPHLHFEVHVDGHPTDPFDYVEVPPEALVDGITPPPLLKRFRRGAKSPRP